MMAEKSKFEEELEKLNINLTEHQKEQFKQEEPIHLPEILLIFWMPVLSMQDGSDLISVLLKNI